MSTMRYYTHDHIENLRLTIILRKVSYEFSGLGVIDEDIPLGTTWSCRFKWQERKNSNVPSGSESIIGREEPLNDSVYLRSYVEGDPFVLLDVSCMTVTLIPHPHTSQINSLLVNSNDKNKWGNDTSHLPDALRMNDISTLKDDNSCRLLSRLQREIKYKRMDIVATIRSTDYVLCSLRYSYDKRLLSVSHGGFSTLDTQDVDQKKGPKLSTKKFRCCGGALYEYAIENESDLMPYHSASDFQILLDLNKKEQQETISRASKRFQTIKTNLASIPQNILDKFVSLKIEIPWLENVTTDMPVFVQVQIRTEHQKLYNSTEQLDGQAWHDKQKMMMASDIRESALNCAHINRHLVGFQTVFNVDKQAQTIFIKVQLHSIDTWQRKQNEGIGYVSVPFTSLSTECFDVKLMLHRYVGRISEQLQDLLLGIDSNKDSVHSHIWPSNYSLGQITESTGTIVSLRLTISDPDWFSLSNSTVATCLTTVAKPAGYDVPRKKSVGEILAKVRQKKEFDINRTVGAKFSIEAKQFDANKDATSPRLQTYVASIIERIKQSQLYGGTSSEE